MLLLPSFVRLHLFHPFGVLFLNCLRFFYKSITPSGFLIVFLHFLKFFKSRRDEIVIENGIEQYPKPRRGNIIFANQIYICQSLILSPFQGFYQCFVWICYNYCTLSGLGCMFLLLVIRKRFLQSDKHFLQSRKQSCNSQSYYQFQNPEGMK